MKEGWVMRWRHDLETVVHLIRDLGGSLRRISTMVSSEKWSPMEVWSCDLGRIMIFFVFCFFVFFFFRLGGWASCAL